MTYCKQCQTSVKGEWAICPLCQKPLEKEENAPSSFLSPPLRFSRQKITRRFINISFWAVILYFIAQWIWSFEFFGLQYVVFGLMVSWILMIILIRKRRNIVKAILYILIFLSLISLYFDYRNGWISWSTTFVIPILSIAALLAIWISVELVDLKAEDYVLYLQLSAIVGVVPLLFLAMNWVGHPVPSLISVIASLLTLITVFNKHKTKIKNELEKRMHV